ncbi:protein phosphatase 2C domain-containing protein [Streptomyces sp. BE147]|uniref:protein phosphatase 2C domain-containing protein n=1 Tax=Streptomyces sp. BE147 TaxID=3002524 RepID=UPI002E78FBAE|nr:protein phosphatase 2C domain-containing protein [Streptomyces sp. BE147]MEE1737756.1 protein phosphatase 2C domain-containing protein [Streptomyces sp. BE147]
MSQQGETPAAHEDDWWRKLYDEAAPDTGPSGAADSLDDRFDSASDAVAPEAPPPAPPAPLRTMAFRAPWEPPSGPPEPRTFAEPVPPPPPPPSPPPFTPSTPPPPLPRRAAGPDAAGHPPAPAPAPVAAPPVAAPPVAAPPAAAPAPAVVPAPRPVVGHLGDRPPTDDSDPAALPAATPHNLDALVPDTVLDGARYGTYTLRTASVRGEAARLRGEPRRDALLTARFGSGESALVLVAIAGGARTADGTRHAAAEACRWIGGAVGRSHARLAEDIRAGRRGDLKSGLHRLIDRTYGKLRARAAELGLEPKEYTAGLRCLLLPADPECRTRVFFGVGSGGLFRLRDGAWHDLEPRIALPPDGRERAEDAPDTEPFRFRASVARPGDTLLLCGNGLAEPMRGEPALAAELAGRWARPGPPGLPAFLADTQLRVEGYADDRTSAAVWEA